MKYYESHYEEYVQSVKAHNIHPEMARLFDRFPRSIPELGNMIFYGAPGSGKYSQLLYFLERYSPSHLKYDKRIRIQTEKHGYTYRISDIHYEIDMALLGCHSKALWHELFFQIVDIISMKSGKPAVSGETSEAGNTGLPSPEHPLSIQKEDVRECEKVGCIVCKNFHLIHSELLEVFYSYMQHVNTLNIHIRFILLTEHISFIPNNILNGCEKVCFRKPGKRQMMETLVDSREWGEEFGHGPRQNEKHAECPAPTPMGVVSSAFSQKITGGKKQWTIDKYTHVSNLVDTMEEETILNLKEIQSFSLAETDADLPKDIFNIICDNIIAEMSNPATLEFTNFRECLYDILIYNLDITECVWYILKHFIRLGYFPDVSETLSQIYVFLKYYNNNYRPIYHLESIFFYLLLQIQENSEEIAG